MKTKRKQIPKEIKYLINGIAYGYLMKNYSDQFRKQVDIENITAMPNSKNTFTIYLFRRGGDGFALRINLKKETILHLGPYSKNRNYSSKEIIQFNKAKKWEEIEKA